MSINVYVITQTLVDMVKSGFNKSVKLSVCRDTMSSITEHGFDSRLEVLNNANQ